MGKQARLRAQRRRQAATADRPTNLLRELFANIRSLTHEHPRRAWEMMLEIMGELSGVNCLESGCLTEGSKKVLRDLPNLESMLKEYVESWHAELEECKATGAAITDPVGSILEENEATNDHLGQFFTPPSVVRMMNALSFTDIEVEPGRTPTGLDPCCGSGRFGLDALVHRDELVMFNVDVDLWMVRAALLNFRYAQRFTYARIAAQQSSAPRIFAEDTLAQLRQRGVRLPDTDDGEGGLIVLGGRSWIIQANSLLVDLQCADNWRYSWLWNPPPWQSTLKMDGFDGTYDEWKTSRSKKEVDRKLGEIAAAPKQPRMDFSLDDDSRLRSLMQRAAARGPRR